MQLPLTAPSENIGAPTLQLSVAVPAPSAFSISSAEGLQPKVNVVPVALITGGVTTVTVTLNEHVAVPQLFVAVMITVVTPPFNPLNVEPLPVPLPLPVVAPLNE